MDEDPTVMVIASLLTLISELADDEECDYDHDGGCQVHHHQRPCANERARMILADSPAPT